ncbi:hypothetical protein L208DRAFT_1377204 [Tricholoma matsutake]|nr:hypothetical protein L208DRAFT_1377204 [Tricholoma matsutake 945]
MAGLSPELAVGQTENFEALPETSFNPKLAVGEGHRTLSWIWYTTTSKEVNNNSFTDASRWKEEIQLLEEEMRTSSTLVLVEFLGGHMTDQEDAVDVAVIEVEIKGEDDGDDSMFNFEE